MSEQWAYEAAKQGRARFCAGAPGNMVSVLVKSTPTHLYAVQFRRADVEAMSLAELAVIAENQMRNVDMEG